MNMLSRLLRMLLLGALLTACGAPAAAGGYWVPPNSPPTPQAELAQVQGGAAALPTDTAVPTFPQPGNTEIPFAPTASSFVVPTIAPPAPTSPVSTANTAPILYYAQAADTLPIVAFRFGVKIHEISSPNPLSVEGFINPGQLLIIPRRLANTTSSQQLIPDSEIVYSPSATSFDAVAFTAEAGGYLNKYSEWHRSTGEKSGAEIIMRVAIENSINPRLLLALLEYHSHWVYGEPASENDRNYPLGLEKPTEKGLYNQLIWAINQISIGYYAYREGRLTEIHFPGGVTARLAPDMNAGTAALQYYFAQITEGQQWLDALDRETGFPALHAQMFGNPWARAQTVEPLYPPGITQPPLILPFSRNWTWSYTGGPHGAWEHDGAYAALDFAPGATEAGCTETRAWAVAAAAGLVVRTGPGLIVLDLDGDGYEQTGWVLVYLHISSEDRIPLGSWVATGDPLGHPSCEGGFATGTHLHIARKYNGEWVPADGPLPFNLGGWIAHAGGEAYKGTLTRDGVTVTACTCSNAASFVTRTNDDP